MTGKATWEWERERWGRAYLVAAVRASGASRRICCTRSAVPNSNSGSRCTASPQRFHRVGTRVTYEPGEVTRRKDCGQRVGVWPCTCQSPALGSTFGGGGLPTMGRPLWDDGSDEDERPPERPPNCDGKTSPERELSDGPRSNWRRSSGGRGRGPSSSSPCGFFVGHLLH